MMTGEVPGTQELREIGALAGPRRSDAPVFATASLGLDEPGFAALTRRRPAACVAAPLSERRPANT